jgi:hypothetical protein
MIRESRLFLPVERFLDPSYLTKREVPIGSKVVDIYGVSRTGKGTVAVELKVDKWRRALRQAATYQIFADLSYVALHRSRICSALEHEQLFRKLGVGLMSVKRDVIVHIEPCPSRLVDSKTPTAIGRNVMVPVIGGNEFEALSVV